MLNSSNEPLPETPELRTNLILSLNGLGEACTVVLESSLAVNDCTPAKDEDSFVVDKPGVLLTGSSSVVSVLAVLNGCGPLQGAAQLFAGADKQPLLFDLTSKPVAVPPKLPGARFIKVVASCQAPPFSLYS